VARRLAVERRRANDRHQKLSHVRLRVSDLIVSRREWPWARDRIKRSLLRPWLVRTWSMDGEGPLEQRRTSGGKPATGGNGRWPWGAPDSQHPTRTPRAENSPRLGLTCRAGGVLRPLRRFLRWSSAAPAVPRRLGNRCKRASCLVCVSSS